MPDRTCTPTGSLRPSASDDDVVRARAGIEAIRAAYQEALRERDAVIRLLADSPQAQRAAHQQLGRAERSLRAVRSSYDVTLRCAQRSGLSDRGMQRASLARLKAQLDETESRRRAARTTIGELESLRGQSEAHLAGVEQTLSRITAVYAYALSLAVQLRHEKRD